MKTLIAIGAVQALFLAALALRKKPLTLADGLLALVLGLWAGLFAVAYLVLAQGWQDLLILLVNAGLLIAPIFHLYARSLMGHGPMDARRLRAFDLVHFVPWIASWLYLGFMVLSGQEALLDAYFAEPRIQERSLAFNAMTFAELVCVPIYVVWVLVRLAEHRRQVERNFAYREGLDLAWLSFLSKAVLTLWAVLAIPDLANLHLGWMTQETVLAMAFALATPLVFVLGFFGLEQTAVFGRSEPQAPHGAPIDDEAEAEGLPATDPSSEIEPDREPQPEALGESSLAPSAKKYRKAGLSADSASEMVVRLKATMEREQPYLESTLSLAGLAEICGFSPHHLSQLINEHLSASFYDFVNGYRVEEFRRRVEKGEAEGRTVLALALDCGFASKSSFNRIFKKATGSTPSAWVKRQKGLRPGTGG